jgi:hypothetical protein
MDDRPRRFCSINSPLKFQALHNYKYSLWYLFQYIPICTTQQAVKWKNYRENDDAFERSFRITFIEPSDTSKLLTLAILWWPLSNGLVISQTVSLACYRLIAQPSSYCSILPRIMKVLILGKEAVYNWKRYTELPYNIVWKVITRPLCIKVYREGKKGENILALITGLNFFSCFHLAVGWWTRCRQTSNDGALTAIRCRQQLCDGTN